MDPLRALADAEPAVLWLDRPDRPDPAPALVGDARCDLAVVGGGFSGLWTALLAKERDPARDVVLLEGHEVAWAASGRNGGFVADSLTHGYRNGVERFGEEYPLLARLGRENLDGLEADVRRLGIDCGWERTGQLDVAVAPWQEQGLREDAAALDDPDVVLLDRDAVRAEVDSPTYLAGLWDRRGAALVDPARLAWGLRRACLERGVRLHERTPVTALDGTLLRTPYGTLRAERVALGTNAFPSLLRRARPFTVPVYDYVLATEPLAPQQRAALGWHHRQGLADAGNQFHYYRLTPDDRVLWGGWDAVYRFGGRVSADHDHDHRTYATLARHFRETFPQLEDVRFTHRWGGAIDTCSRFSAFFGTAAGGRVAYSAGYTGLGVGATRFGAQVVLDLLAGEPTERTRLGMVRRKPVPFPPEPLAWAGIQLTRRALARADRRGGRRGPWLRTMDALGLGFDS
nr:FAD-binding oxidoreductase [Vallicoccus soli]